MKIRYAALAVACALMVAAVTTTSAQAAVVTYYFGGALNSVSVGVPLAVGDSFAGSFTFDSTTVNLGAALPSIGNYSDGSSAIEVNVNGYFFSSDSTSACVNTCVGIRLFNDTPPAVFGDIFTASNALLGNPATVTGPNLDGLSPSVLSLQLFESSGTAFSSIALPSNLLLSSFDGTNFAISFIDTARSGQSFVANGPLAYLSTTAPIPEASTTAMLALGLSALAFVRRRKSH